MRLAGVNFQKVIPEKVFKTWTSNSQVKPAFLSQLDYIQYDNQEEWDIINDFITKGKGKYSELPKRINEVIYETIKTIMDAWTSTSNTRSAALMYATKPIFDIVDKYVSEIRPNKKYKLAYRGNDLPHSKLKAFINATGKQSWSPTSIDNHDYMVYTGQKFDYKPRRIVQSWTIDPAVAVDFAYGTLLATKIDDSFYIDPKLYDILNLGYPEEAEVVHIGKEAKVVLAIETELFNKLTTKRTSSDSGYTSAVKQAFKVK